MKQHYKNINYKQRNKPLIGLTKKETDKWNLILGKSKIAKDNVKFKLLKNKLDIKFIEKKMRLDVIN